MDESYQMEWRQSSLRHRKRRRAWRREHRAPGRRRMWTTLYIEIGLMHGHDGPWTISTTEGVLARLRDIRYFQHTHTQSQSVRRTRSDSLSIAFPPSPTAVGKISSSWAAERLGNGKPIQYLMFAVSTHIQRMKERWWMMMSVFWSLLLFIFVFGPAAVRRLKTQSTKLSPRWTLARTWWRIAWARSKINSLCCKRRWTVCPKLWRATCPSCNHNRSSSRNPATMKVLSVNCNGDINFSTRNRLTAAVAAAVLQELATVLGIATAAPVLESHIRDQHPVLGHLLLPLRPPARSLPNSSHHPHPNPNLISLITRFKKKEEEKLLLHHYY